jgi:hypothetical protein
VVAHKATSVKQAGGGLEAFVWVFLDAAGARSEAARTRLRQFTDDDLKSVQAAARRLDRLCSQERSGRNSHGGTGE